MDALYHSSPQLSFTPPPPNTFARALSYPIDKSILGRSQEDYCESKASLG